MNEHSSFVMPVHFNGGDIVLTMRSRLFHAVVAAGAALAEPQIALGTIAATTAAIVGGCGTISVPNFRDAVTTSDLVGWWSFIDGPPPDNPDLTWWDNIDCCVIDQARVIDGWYIDIGVPDLAMPDVVVPPDLATPDGGADR